MATIEQIRAARALLGWSQKDLAAEAGLSQTGIARLENGTHQPNSQTTEKILAAFDRGGIEFLGRRGLQKKTNEVEVLKGREGFRSFMDDVYHTAYDQGGEICLFNGVPAEILKWLGPDEYKMHAERMAAISDRFDFKVIVRSGDDLLIGKNFASYRWFPKELFHERTFYAYGDKLAFLSFGADDVHILVLRQAEFAASFRVLFSIAWLHATPPKGEI